MTHDEASELLASLALDAVDDDERALIEAHVATCPRCQSELDALREVAAALGNSVEVLPEGIWPSISRRIYEDQSGETNETPELDLDALAAPVSLDAARASSYRSRRVVGSLAAVAAAVAVVLAFTLANVNGHVSRLQKALALASHSEVRAALAAPGHRLVNLDGADDVMLAQFVVLPDGRGYLVKSSMPKLVGDETYQLWGVINNKAISIGLMGRSPGDVTFTVSGSPRPSKLAVTVEPSGGTSTPTAPAVATGLV
jgi:anti-sigma-K factor RskA